MTAVYHLIGARLSLFKSLFFRPPANSKAGGRIGHFPLQCFAATGARLKDRGRHLVGARAKPLSNQLFRSARQSVRRAADRPSVAASRRGLPIIGLLCAIIEPSAYSLVGATGFEPATPSTPCWCASRLRYAPFEKLWIPRPMLRMGAPGNLGNDKKNRLYALIISLMETRSFFIPLRAFMYSLAPKGRSNCLSFTFLNSFTFFRALERELVAVEEGFYVYY